MKIVTVLYNTELTMDNVNHYLNVFKQQFKDTTPILLICVELKDVVKQLAELSIKSKICYTLVNQNEWMLVAEECTE